MNRRAGTENLPGILGAAKAFEMVLQNQESEAQRLRDLRDSLWQCLQTGIKDIRLNGHPTQRLPNNLNVCFKNVEAEGLLLRLSIQGIEASMGSACNSESIEPSHVIKALGIQPEWARGALRLTLGSQTTAEDIAYAADVIIKTVKEIQAST
jgi:cysteine desulfurase